MLLMARPPLVLLLGGADVLASVRPMISAPRMTTAVTAAREELQLALNWLLPDVSLKDVIRRATAERGVSHDGEEGRA